MNIFGRVTGALFRAFARVKAVSERGASSVEYGIVASLIAAVIVVSVFYLGQQTNGNFECTKNSVVAKTNQC